MNTFKNGEHQTRHLARNLDYCQGVRGTSVCVYIRLLQAPNLTIIDRFHSTTNKREEKRKKKMWKKKHWTVHKFLFQFVCALCVHWKKKFKKKWTKKKTENMSANQQITRQFWLFASFHFCFNFFFLLFVSHFFFYYFTSSEIIFSWSSNFVFIYFFFFSFLSSIIIFIIVALETEWDSIVLFCFVLSALNFVYRDSVWHWKSTDEAHWAEHSKN